jgi:short-subunit dehydrogenase
MRSLAGQTVLLTGASGGLGVCIAREFARLGTKLALVAYPDAGLDDIRREAEKCGAQVLAVAADLCAPDARRAVVKQVEKQFGSVDVLVNNAGIELTAPYHDLSEENIREVISINLEAAMILTRLVLPGMLRRGRGHIVNMSSLAGKTGPAFEEPYSATKAALVAFTFSLRATYRGSGVSASVVVPAFVEAGIYARLKAATGCAAPGFLTGNTPEDVARAVVRAICEDRSEIIVNRYPIRFALACAVLSPKLGDWVSARIGVDQFFRRVVEAEKRVQP